MISFQIGTILYLSFSHCLRANGALHGAEVTMHSADAGRQNESFVIISFLITDT